MNALYFLGYAKDFDFVQMLLKRGININQTDSRGDTPLIDATRSGNPKLVELLVRSGANLNIENDEGETALSIAINDSTDARINEIVESNRTRTRNDLHEIIAILKAAGAKEN
jgi:ankyrin repeat protein